MSPEAHNFWVGATWFATLVVVVVILGFSISWIDEYLGFDHEHEHTHAPHTHEHEHEVHEHPHPWPAHEHPHEHPHGHKVVDD